MNFWRHLIIKKQKNFPKSNFAKHVFEHNHNTHFIVKNCLIIVNKQKKNMC